MNPLPLAGPAVEPVPLVDVKLYLRLDGDDEDDLVSALIVAARIAVERATRLALVSQSWRWRGVVDAATRSMRLPLAPVLSVEAVRLGGATADPLDATAVQLDAACDPPRVVFTADALGAGAPLDGTVDFTVGFGATGAAVPEPLRLAIRRLAAAWFSERGDGPERAGSGLPADVEALLAPFRRPRLA